MLNINAILLSVCSCWSSNQSKDVSLVLTDSLKLNKEYLSHQKKKTQHGLNVWLSNCALSALLIWTMEASSALSFFMQCETKLFCFKSFILIHILFCRSCFFVLFLFFPKAINAFFIWCVQFLIIFLFVFFWFSIAKMVNFLLFYLPLRAL